MNSPDRSPSDGVDRRAPPSDDSAILEIAGPEAEALTDVGDLGRVGAGHDAADDGHAERATDLAGGVVDGGADAGLRPGSEPMIDSVAGAIVMPIPTDMTQKT